MNLLSYRLVVVLAISLGLCHVLYMPLGQLYGGDAPAVQRKLYYILRGVEGMTLCWLLVYLAPLDASKWRLAIWNGIACWGFVEEEQTAACRIATWSTPVKQLNPSGICADAFDAHVYLAVLAAALAWVGMKWGRRAWSSKAM